MLLEDVKKLAELARVDMNEGEMESVAKDFDAILAYVGHVNEVSKLKNLAGEERRPEDYFLHNVVREDIPTNKEGEYKDKILKEMPETQDGFLKVEQIL